MKGLAGRAAIVTGAGQGIGRAIAERLLAEGARVLAVDKTDTGLATLPASDRLRAMVQDSTSDDAPARIVAECLAAFGQIDVLVNNVGVGNAPGLEETTDELFDFYMDVNLRTTFRLSRAAMPALKQSKGAVVNIASSVGMAGYRRWAAYASAKAGVVGLTRQMASEYGPAGVRTNAVAPGIIATPQTAERLGTAEFRARIVSTMPLGMPGTPEDIAAAVAFLASDEARFITGQVLTVDGGQTSSVYVSDGMIEAAIAAGAS